MKEGLIRIKRVAGKLVRDNHMRLFVPMAVWDNTGRAIGATIEADKKMGGVDCIAKATFVLQPHEYANDELILLKASTAIHALKLEVQVSICPKVKVPENA